MELSWKQKLFHIRFSRLVLLCEKWFSIMIICWLLLFGITPTNLTITGILFFAGYFWTHANHYNLEEAAGLPVNRVNIKI